MKISDVTRNEERDGVCLRMRKVNSEPEGMGCHLNKLEFLPNGRCSLPTNQVGLKKFIDRMIPSISFLKSDQPSQSVFQPGKPLCLIP